MAMVNSSPAFNKTFDPQTGRAVEVAPNIVRVTAPNAGPYTFTGTNSFIVGGSKIVVVDPGPNSDAHLSALIKALHDRPVEAILLTHTHKDHCDLVPRLVEAIGQNTPLWFGGKHRLSRKRRAFEINVLAGACDWQIKPDRILTNGDIIDLNETRLNVVATPGHCANHLCFGVEGSPHILTGDHVMGWNSTLVATPDGSMHDYFISLDRLIDAEWNHYLPAHGGHITDGKQFARALKTHRRMRNGQIVSAVGRGATSIGEIVNSLYPNVGPKIKQAAAMIVTAHVEHLADTGKLTARYSVFGTKLGLPKVSSVPDDPE